MTQELKIVSAEISNEIQKGRGMRGRVFYVTVMYTDENGGHHNGTIEVQRKKDMLAAIARKQKAVAEGNLSMQGGFNQNWGNSF